MLNNTAGAQLIDANLHWPWPITYTEQEQGCARALQQATGIPQVGMDTEIRSLDGQEAMSSSTDVGDVSWIVPVLHFTVATAPKGTPWHSWPVVAASGTSIGHKGLVLAAKTLAAPTVDLYEQPAALKAVRDEFETRRGDVVRRPCRTDRHPSRRTDARLTTPSRRLYDARVCELCLNARCHLR
jgi:aminobenzoyl-glutamate utilization protein B